VTELPFFSFLVFPQRLSLKSQAFINIFSFSGVDPALGKNRDVFILVWLVGYYTIFLILQENPT
jgi:hypothetical protein